MANGRIIDGPEEGVELDLAFPSAPTLHRRFEDQILNYSVTLRLDDDGNPVGYDVAYVDSDPVIEAGTVRDSAVHDEVADEKPVRRGGSGRR